MPLADVELTIVRFANGAATAGLRVELPGRRADLAEGVPVTLDETELHALALNPSAYGEALTDMVFGRRKLREAWQRALGFAEGEGGSLRIRLVLNGDDALHAVRWELLRDPTDGSPLVYSERVLFSRFLSSPSLADVQAPARPDLSAAVAVANPPSLATFGLAAVNVAGEVAQAQQSLGAIRTTILDGRGGRPAATISALTAALRDGVHILYLVCHGTLVEGEPALWLEQEGGSTYKPVAGRDLVQAISLLERRPLLVVLASCQSAGDTYQMLAAVGPQLARAGVGAVLAMQGNVTTDLVTKLTPRFFSELHRDGKVDRALAAARAALLSSENFWVPTLWLAARDGALWHDEPGLSDTQPDDQAPSHIPEALVEALRYRTVVLFVGPVLSEMVGFPSLNELASRLGAELDASLHSALPEEALLLYELKFGREKLLKGIQALFRHKTNDVSSLHHEIAQLPVAAVVTTAFDDLIERSLLANHRTSMLVNVPGGDALPEGGELPVVYLYGCLSQDLDLVVTRDDLEEYSEKQQRLLAELVDRCQQWVGLFIGFDNLDFNLRSFLAKITQAKPSWRAFSVQIKMNPLKSRELERLGLTVLNLPLDTDRWTTLHSWVRSLRQAALQGAGWTERLPELNVDEHLYRDWLRAATDALELRGIGNRGAVEARRIRLFQLYIQLHQRQTITDNPGAGQGKHQIERIPLVNVVDRHPYVLVVGPPGSGKSTFLQYLARIGADEVRKRLPLLARATELYSFMVAPRAQAVPPHDRFVRYWLDQSRTHRWHFTEPWLREQFQRGQVRFLIDGLDELPSHEARVAIVQVVDHAVQQWPACHWVLTSRPNTLGGPALPLNFRPAEIDLLSDEEISSFIHAWVLVLYQSEDSAELVDRYSRKGAVVYTRELLEAIRDRPDVRLLARNPVMLTSIAVVHWNEMKLPEGKSELYDAVMSWLINARRDTTERFGRKLALQCYQRLALAMHQHPEGRRTEVGLAWAANCIAPLHQGATPQEQTQAALDFLEREEVNTGLLVRRGKGNLAFWHTSFQEYLAACEVAGHTDDEANGWWAVIKSRLHEPGWSEVIRFIPTILHRLGDDRVDLFIGRVLATRSDASLAETARVIGYLGPLLHDLVLYQYTIDRLPEYITARDEVLAIFARGKGDALPIDVRIEAAIALGRAGDPRLESADQWVLIPAGSAVVGAQSSDPALPNYDPFAGINEQPVFRAFSQSFEIGKYPVTVQEYARFVAARGYADRAFWGDEGWAWRETQSVPSPGHWDTQLTTPNCPVVYITWHEAQAYCRWLSRRDDGFAYMLPTEAQWEYMARAGQSSYWRFVFGNQMPQEIGSEMNWEEASNERLTPVGLFPLDATSHGVADVNGNVYEWVQDDGPYTYSAGEHPAGRRRTFNAPFRYLRGGGVHSPARLHRTAARSCVLAELRYDDLGFRVLRVPSPIAIKGRQPALSYDVSLSEFFARYDGRALSRAETDAVLAALGNRFGIPITTNVLDQLFPLTRVGSIVATPRSFPTLDLTPPEKCEFNLRYQDSRVKLAVEEHTDVAGDPTTAGAHAAYLLDVMACLLMTETMAGHPLWRDLTDNDLDALTFLILDQYDPTRAERLIAQGHRTNELALAGMPDTRGWSLERLIAYQIFAGTVWWQECEPNLSAQFPQLRYDLEVDDRATFRRSVLGRPCRMAFFFDDNGEL